jgi:hypothetical protein
LHATSEVDKEARNAIGENLEAYFYGVDVGMNHQRAEANSWSTFVYKIDAKLDTMSTEDVLGYARFYLDGSKKVIQNNDPNQRLVCVLFRKLLTHFMIVYF